MMTLDEAIKTAEEIALSGPYEKESQQLAEWLKELKELRVQMSMIYTACTAARAATNFAELGNILWESNVKAINEAYWQYRIEKGQGVVGDPRDIRVLMEELKDENSK